MPNIFEIANIQRRKGVIVSRLERIKREGSPWYLYQLPVTAAGVTVILNMEAQFPASRKYAPLDFMEIVNNEVANPLNVVLNGGDSFYCPAGTIRPVHGRGIALWQLGITNLGAGATTLGLVRFNFKKEAMTIDRWAQEQ